MLLLGVGSDSGYEFVFSPYSEGERKKGQTRENFVYTFSSSSINKVNW